MKSTRQRIIAGILTLVLLTGQAGGTIIYAESQDGDGTAPLTETEPTLEETQTMEEVQVPDNLQVTEIAGFTELPEEVRSRQAEYGTPQDELMLPEELEASVQGENVIIEGITWISDPEYNGEIPGAYIFTAVLPQESSYVPAEGVEMPKIDVTVEPQTEGSEDQPDQTEQPEQTEQGKNSEGNGADENEGTEEGQSEEENGDEGTDQDVTPEEEAAMLAGLELDPEILTEEDVLAAAPELAMVQTYGLRSASETHPATYFVGEDNENNAGTGSPDGDIDAYIRMNLSRHPIEVAIDIPEGQLPAVSAYLAVRTNDVDWQDGEYDLLYINDHRVAPLTGLSSQWNTSFYQIPVSYLKEGKNIVKVMINDIDPDDFRSFHYRIFYHRCRGIYSR